MLRSSKALTAVLLLGATIVVGGCQSVLELKVGDCFDGGDGVDGLLGHSQACAEPHAREVFATPTYAASTGAYPGEALLSSFAETECLAAFQPYVERDYPSSELFIAYLTPSTETGPRATASWPACSTSRDSS